MAVFRYSLQSILNIKMKMETQAKQDFSAAKALLNEEENRLAQLVGRKTDYENQAQQLRMGLLNVRDIEDNKNAILTMEQYIEAQKQRIRVAEKRVNAARERLTDVVKDRKIHETLKEKAFEEFVQDENRAESKTVDELTSYTYGQKQQVKEAWQEN